MLYVFSTSVKAFVFDSRFVFKSRLIQTVTYYGRRVVALCYHFAYSVYNPLIALSRVCPMHLVFCDFALVLFLAGIALYSTFLFKLSWFFYIIIRFVIAP